MFFYRTKPIKVEAVEWKPTLDITPYWLESALAPDGKVKRVPDKLQVTTSNGTKMANVGDWIVYNTSTTRDLEVYSPSEFNKKFEVDERPSRLRGWRADER